MSRLSWISVAFTVALVTLLAGHEVKADNDSISQIPFERPPSSS